MIKKALYEELIIHIDKDEMARLLDLEPGFAVQNIEEEGEAFRLILSRKTDLSEKRHAARSGEVFFTFQRITWYDRDIFTIRLIFQCVTFTMSHLH